jgi:hypothetical protein
MPAKPKAPKTNRPGPSPPTKPEDLTLLVPFSLEQLQVTLAIVTRATVPNARGKQLQGEAQALMENVLQSVPEPSPPETKE